MNEDRARTDAPVKDMDGRNDKLFWNDVSTIKQLSLQSVVSVPMTWRARYSQRVRDNQTMLLNCDTS